MYENEFQTRLAQLRENKGVSARDMSLSIGQQHSNRKGASFDVWIFLYLRVFAAFSQGLL